MPRLLLLALLVFSAPALAGSSLAQARVDASSAAFVQARESWTQGLLPLDDVYLWSLRWMGSSVDAGETTAKKAHLDRMVELQSTVAGRVQQGMAPAFDATAATYYVAEARVWAGK